MLATHLNHVVGITVVDMFRMCNLFLPPNHPSGVAGLTIKSFADALACALVKNEEDDEGMPKLVGRPEKWSIAQHDLAICQWSGFGWAQCDVCLKWRKPSVSGVDLDVNENDRFVCSDMGTACPQVLS